MADLLELPPDVSSVRTARLFVVDKLQEWHHDSLVDSAALLTSELATNAVVHTRRPYSVSVRRGAGGVRIEVTDASPDRPHVPAHLARAAASLAAEGDVLSTSADEVDRLFSGLGMVNAMADDWGSDPVPGDGKVVWFELRADTHAENKGLVALRRDGHDDLSLPADLPPLSMTGLDEGAGLLWGRVLAIVALVVLAAVVVSAALWAGGVIGQLWYVP